MTIQADCRALESPNGLTVFLASFILVGILVSYLPQHAKIISNRTSEGLSPWWVLLGAVSSIAALANIMTLPQSRHDMGCCKQLTGGECAAALLGVAQIGLQWGCFMFIVMLFLIYFPTNNGEVDLSSSTASLTHSAPSKRRDQIIVGATTMVFLLGVGIASIALVVAQPSRTKNWADFLGTVAGILAMVQYVPQIYYTWQLGEIGSLSIITMLIQVPGAFLFAFSLWLRVGWPGWSTWLMYVVTGILQAILLAMAISYWYRGRKSEYIRANGERSGSDDLLETPSDSLIGVAENQVVPTEDTPLLGKSSSTTRKLSGSVHQSARKPSIGSRQLSLLYAATPPDQDSDPSSEERR